MYDIVITIILGIIFFGVGYIIGENSNHIFLSPSENEYIYQKADCLQSQGSEDICESTGYITTLEKYYPNAIEEYVEQK